MLDSLRVFNSGGKGESRGDIYVLRFYSTVVTIINYVRVSY